MFHLPEEWEFEVADVVTDEPYVIISDNDKIIIEKMVNEIWGDL